MRRFEVPFLAAGFLVVIAIGLVFDGRQTSRINELERRNDEQDKQVISLKTRMEWQEGRLDRFKDVIERLKTDNDSLLIGVQQLQQAVGDLQQRIRVIGVNK